MAENTLSFDNILGEQEIDTLFSDPDEAVTEQEETSEDKDKDGEKEDKETTTTEVVNPDDLFEDEPQEKQPEGVGSEKNKEDKEKEDASTDDNSGASPNQNFYSSIANAMAVDGIFPNLTEDDIKKATDAESFSDLMEAEINARLDDRQKRVSKALDNGVEATDIRKYEGTLEYLNRVTEAQLSEEGENGERLRRQLIFQDFLNKGYTPEKAQKFTDRTINAGTDVEDAKEALQSNKDYFANEYNDLLRKADEDARAEKEAQQKTAAKLKDSMMTDKTLMGDMVIDKSTRQKAYESITKPVYRDPDTGEYFTAVQKYERDHSTDFAKYVGLMYTLTDGFKDFESFTKGKVKKEVRKGLRELEHTLNNTSRDNNGNLNMVTNVRDDPASYLGKGFKLMI